MISISVTPSQTGRLTWRRVSAGLYDNFTAHTDKPSQGAILVATRHYISPGDWIRISGTDCVVCQVWPPGNAPGDCEVVFDPDNPRVQNVYWTGDEWEFAKRGEFGDQAVKHARLRTFVDTLKAGRPALRWPF